MYVGLDLGTSGVKAVLIDDDQKILGEAVASLEVSRPQSGWSEQNPAHWISAVETVISQLKSETDLSAVKSIGLSGQMHGATLLDNSHEVLRPSILWNDTRAAVQAAALDALPEFRSVTGNIVFPGFTAPKINWVRAHEPHIFERTALVLLPKDYVRLWLTGDAVSEMSDASGTSWLDVGARDWSDDLLAKTGLERKNMPGLVEGSAVSGTLRDSLASDWGLPKGVKVAGGGGDNAATAIGVGVVTPGEAFLSLGTSGVLFAATDAFQPDAETAVHTFCHALPDTWHQMGVILAATDALNWLSKVSGRSPAELTQNLGTLRAPSPTTFLPYLGGERTPHNDAAIRGSFTRLDHATDLAALTRSVLEGVAFAFRDSLEALRQTGTEVSRVTAVGGGSQSVYWLQAISTALNLPIDVPEDGDFGAAFGAARLGMMAETGAGAELATRPKCAKQINPDQTLSDAFGAAYSDYRKTYEALKAI